MIHRAGRLALACAVFGLGLAFWTAGCTKQPAAGTGTLTIAVIPKGTTHEYWQSVHAGAAKAAKELGIHIIWKGPLKEDDREQQIAVVENFITQQVAGIVLAPLDETALVRPVQEARDAHIPTVIIDSNLKGHGFISFVATDNHKGGMLGGQELIRLLGDKGGKVVMLRYEEGSASTMYREQGFLDAIAAYNAKAPAGAKIEVVSSNQYGGATASSAQDASERMLSTLKGPGGRLTIDGIFCPNESTTFGMLRTLQTNGWAGKVKFVGFDSSEPLVAGLKDGQIDALVVQNPVNMGYLGVKTLVDHLRGQTVPTHIDTGVGLITRANMNDPAQHKLLHPDLSKWLD